MRVVLRFLVVLWLLFLPFAYVLCPVVWIFTGFDVDDYMNVWDRLHAKLEALEEAAGGKR